MVILSTVTAAVTTTEIIAAGQITTEEIQITIIVITDIRILLENENQKESRMRLFLFLSTQSTKNMPMKRNPKPV